MYKNFTLLFMFLLFDNFNIYPILQITPVTIGDNVVLVQKEIYGHKIFFVHLHQNEVTALKAARIVAKRMHGEVLTLKHSGSRNIEFSYKNKEYKFDPNRIFSNNGINASLDLYSQIDSRAFYFIKSLRYSILNNITSEKIIAVHNNHDYSLKEYYKEHPLFDTSKALHIAKDKFYRNFFLVTKDLDYYRIKNLDYNIVLQKKDLEDDGSLSILWKNKSYINVEAGYKELNAQINMLVIAHSLYA